MDAYDFKESSGVLGIREIRNVTVPEEGLVIELFEDINHDGIAQPGDKIRIRYFSKVALSSDTKVVFFGQFNEDYNFDLNTPVILNDSGKSGDDFAKDLIYSLVFTISQPAPSLNFDLKKESAGRVSPVLMGEIADKKPPTRGVAAFPFAIP